MKALKQSAYDGVCPMVLQQHSYAFILVTLYAYPSINMTGKNVDIVNRLGGLLRSTRMPW